MASAHGGEFSVFCLPFPCSLCGHAPQLSVCRLLYIHVCDRCLPRCTRFPFARAFGKKMPARVPSRGAQTSVPLFKARRWEQSAVTPSAGPASAPVCWRRRQRSPLRKKSPEMRRDVAKSAPTTSIRLFCRGRGKLLLLLLLLLRLVVAVAARSSRFESQKQGRRGG